MLPCFRGRRGEIPGIKPGLHLVAIGNSYRILMSHMTVDDLGRYNSRYPFEPGVIMRGDLTAFGVEFIDIFKLGLKHRGLKRIQAGVVPDVVNVIFILTSMFREHPHQVAQLGILG